jgi:S1-C subfamily serine protease
MNQVNQINLIFIGITLCLIGLFKTSTIAASEMTANPPSQAPEEYNLNYNLDELRTLAHGITVKIYSGNTSGSGIILKKDDNLYTVITNDHVLSRGKNDYRVQTADNQIYSATIIPNPQFNNYDLGLLRFSSNRRYQVATLGNSNNLQKGDLVMAAGYPITANVNVDNGFNFTQGLITMIASKSLEDGYQIGYTNMIQKGMSGGPLLNVAGEVVAINGMHAYPLWGDPYLYHDGAQPSPEEKEVMIRSSWGIPINTLSQLTDVTRF